MGLGLGHPVQIKPRFDRKLTPLEPLAGTPVQTRNIAVLQGALLRFRRGRRWWRPFGPSTLAGHEAEWFDPAFDSPFMLFTVPVREDKQGEIPAVLHVDGTTRPQSVHPTHNPRYHAMISHFHHGV